MIVVFVAAECALAVVAAFVATRAAEKRAAELRARGICPEEEKAAEDDVLRPLQAGEKIMAIRCYREIHKVGLMEARDTVELLEKGDA